MEGETPTAFQQKNPFPKISADITAAAKKIRKRLQA
jgi:hypothetical protein